MSQAQVLLVVRADNPQDPKRQLEWLEQNIFPKAQYRNRRLMFVGPSLYVQKLDEPWLFDAFKDYQDAYSKLRGEGYFTETFDAPHHFDFALLIHIRRNFASGMGYGLEECRAERCLLRAVFLAARGNVLFCDWGLPLATRPDVTREQLLARRTMNQYVYPQVARRRYPDQTGNVPFTQVIDHFLTPVYEADSGLPAKHMEAIRQATEGSLFSEYQLKLAVRNAWWNLFFSTDLYCLVYHRWIHFRSLQRVIVRGFVYIMAYFVSSSWLELFIDMCGFIPMSLFYGSLSSAGTNYINNGEFTVSSHTLLSYQGVISSVLRYTAWMTLALILLKIELIEPQDRIPIWEKIRGFLPYSILLPLCDVLVSLWLKRSLPHFEAFLAVWLSVALVDLASMWFLVPMVRNGFSIAVQGIIIVVLFQVFDDLDIAAKLIMEQPLYFLPLFRWNRLRMNKDVLRTAFVVPWISSTFVVVVRSTVLMLQASNDPSHVK